MVIPMPEATSEISVGISTAPCETLGVILASRSISPLGHHELLIRHFTQAHLFPFCQFVGGRHHEYELFAVHGDNIEARMLADRQTKKSNVERPALQHLYLLRRQNIAQRELYVGI